MKRLLCLSFSAAWLGAGFLACSSDPPAGGADGGPVPTALVAVTVKVYAVPLASRLMTWLRPVLPALLSTPPAGSEVTE